uniref:Phospholipase n=1 Tax=Panagrellus redivivus TaxID=6233 RepID=A0A7E4VB52_PANRE
MVANGNIDHQPGDELVCTCDTEAAQSPRRRRGYIPYSSVYESQDEYRRNGYWIPGLPIDVRIVKVERDAVSAIHLLNPYVYTIEVEHGKFKWQIQKRYKDFSVLATQLMNHRAIVRMKNPFVRLFKSTQQEISDAIHGREHRPGCPFYDSPNMEVHPMPRANEMPYVSLDEANRQFPVDAEDTKRPTSSSNSSNGSTANETDVLNRQPAYMPGSPPANIPHFPITPDSMIGTEHISERKQRLEEWLRAALTLSVNRNYHEMAEFFEISRYSFINEIGGKYKEGMLKKRPGGGKVYVGMKQCCVRYLLPWTKRWLLVKDTYLCYINPSNERVRMVLLMDEGFKVNPKEFEGVLKEREFLIVNQQHVLHMKCKRIDDAEYWCHKIDEVVASTGQLWLNPKRFGSSFPVRDNGLCEWFVDARGYWERAANMIEFAREEVFIADWWLCPEVFMKRPMAEGNRWRLDMVLKRAAERGVKIFVLVYKEVEFALGLNSLYSKRHLQGLHPNIKVMRHPDHYFSTGTFLWAHHEKLIIIDQLVAFVGGIDLCYGRWDDHKHVLTDLGSIQVEPRKPDEFNMTNGLVAAVEAAASDNNKDAVVVQQYLDEKGKPLEEDVFYVEAEKKPSRLKANMSKVINIKRNAARQADLDAKGGDSADALKSALGEHKGVDLPSVKVSAAPATASVPTEQGPGGDSASAPRTPTAANAALKVWRQRPRKTPSSGEHDTKSSLRPRKSSPKPKKEKVDLNEERPAPPGTHSVQFVVRRPRERSPHSRNPLRGTESRNSNVLRKVIANLQTNRTRRRWRYAIETEDQTDEYLVNYYRAQEAQPDMSGLQGAGKLFPGKDYVNYIHKDFIEVEDAFTDFTDRYTIPRMPWHDIHSVTYGEVARDVARHFIQRWNATKSEKLKDNEAYPYLVPKSYDWIKIPKVFLNANTFPAEIQVLRSVANWSTLIDHTECSIQQAYLSLIANSKHYIYIENQFFVSLINSPDVTTNEICKVICERIIKAHRDGETYRVYIMIPLLPGFEGDLKNLQYSALLAVLHFTYLSISRGPHSLMECLKKAGVDDPWRYVSFNGIRTYDELCGKLTTEFIYVHCKLLIVDDLHTIIGSANINDRSQAGNRDSEVCLCITDKEFVPSLMNGKPYRGGKFATSLRKRLMSEHLGLLEGVLHPSRPEFDINLEDPICDSFFVDVWCKIASDNTRIYEDVFRVIPTDMVESFDQLREWTKELSLADSNPDEAKSRLRKTIGNLVQFPTMFLVKENLSPQITSKEGLAPTALFV